MPYCRVHRNNMEPTHTASNYNNLKIVQRKAARFVCNDYYRYFSVSDMLQQLGWPTLEHWWLEARVTMIHKITNNLVQVDQRYLCYNLRSPHGHSLHLYRLPTRIDVYCHSPHQLEFETIFLNS